MFAFAKILLPQAVRSTCSQVSFVFEPNAKRVDGDFLEGRAGARGFGHGRKGGRRAPSAPHPCPLGEEGHDHGRKGAGGRRRMVMTRRGVL